MTFGLVNRSPLWLFPATPKTPQTPNTPSRSRAMTLPTTPLHTEHLNPIDTDEETTKKRPTSDIVPSLLLLLQGNHSERANAPLTSARFQGPLSPFSIMTQESELDTPLDGDNEDAPWIRKFDFREEPEWSTISTPLRPRTPSPTEMYTARLPKQDGECDLYLQLLVDMN